MFVPGAVHLCACSEPSACRCASSSHVLHLHNLKPPTTSQNILRDILTARYRTRSRISVLYSDLKTIQHALTLHTIPHHDMDLVQCRQALIHHLVTGACADHNSDVNLVSRLDRSTCRAVAQNFDSAAAMSAAALNIILAAEHTKISTEHLCHVAAALNFAISRSTRNLRFKIKAAIRKHLLTVESAPIESRSSASVADFFDSFESHRRPILKSIAALHRVELPEKPAVDQIRTAITKHILSGDCSQFSHSHPPSSLPPDVSVPDCVDVHNEWRINTIDPDVQVHISVCNSRQQDLPKSNASHSHQPQYRTSILRQSPNFAGKIVHLYPRSDL